MIQYLKDRMSSISSDLYEKCLKPNKSHANRIIQIVYEAKFLNIFDIENPPLIPCYYNGIERAF